MSLGCPLARARRRLPPLRRCAIYPCFALSLVLGHIALADPQAPSASTEPSVRPGINAEFLKTNFSVQPWVQRFEGESREIYREREKIMAALQLRPGQAVADIGAGTGLFVPYLAQAVESYGLVFAVDISPDFIKHLKARIAERKITNAVPVLCTERSVRLPPQSIDVAFLCDVYHHFEYPKSSLASIHRALRPNGSLVLVEFKRIPGESSDWVMDHVRAGEEVFTKEIEAAGFRKTESYPILKENYVLRFRKVDN